MTTQLQWLSTHSLHLKVLSLLPTRQPKPLRLFLRLLPLPELPPRLPLPLEPQLVQRQVLLPVIMTMYFGMLEFSQAIGHDRKGVQLARTLADRRVAME